MNGTLIDYLSNSRMGPSRINVWVTKKGEVVLGGQGIPAPGITIPRGTSIAIEVGTEAYRGSDITLRTRIVRETLPANRCALPQIEPSEEDVARLVDQHCKAIGPCNCCDSDQCQVEACLAAYMVMALLQRGKE